MSQKRVAIIGAGPCGLGQLRAFALARGQGQGQGQGEDIPQIVCFEQQEDWGGLWNYSWRTGSDGYGEPVHASMYRYLWSNGPKECLEFADYTFEKHFGKAIPSFPPRGVLEDYIIGRIKDSKVEAWMRFNTKVVHIEKEGEKFALYALDLKTRTSQKEMFDNVIVATGHFSVPNVPYIEGIEKFAGRVMHSHDFREAREFTARHVLTVGASYSAEDIALQCHKYGAASVTTCYRTAAMGFDWPKGMDERPLLTKVEGKTVSFKDGSQKDFDAIILCTGYLHHFPFLAEALQLHTHNRLYPPNLYKGVLWQDDTSLIYLGMQDQFYTFTMFDAQAWWVRDVIMGKIAVPSTQERSADIAKWLKREEALENDHQMIDFQADYIRELLQVVDYPKFDLDLTAKHFKEWEHHKEESITGYRDRAFSSPCTGTMSPIHHTQWLEAMDDSVATYLKTKKLRH